MKGKFIVVEGGDGSGKSTQVDLLEERMGGENILFVRDPGGTDIGLKIREILQYQSDLTEVSELFLFLASRAQLAKQIIVPALESGTHVISNRYDLSTLAYQVYGRNRADQVDLISQMSLFARIIEPDLYIFLDVLPEVGLARVQTRNDLLTRIEKEKLDFHTRVYEGYKKHLKDHAHRVIDGAQPIEMVYDQIKTIVDEITDA